MKETFKLIYGRQRVTRVTFACTLIIWWCIVVYYLYALRLPLSSQHGYSFKEFVSLETTVARHFRVMLVKM